MDNNRLSKSKILSGIQCHKRLWLETHRRDLAVVSPASQHIFRMGHLFGDKARELMGPGELIRHERDIRRALADTPAALERASTAGTTVYEAAFSYQDVVSRADGFSPYLNGWHMTEVKAATTSKEYFYLDCAIQTWVAEGAGYPVTKVTLAYINNAFIYPGNGAYSGLLQTEDVTGKVSDLKVSLDGLVDELRAMLAQPEPRIRTGEQCSKPYECPFIAYCRSGDPPEPEFPVEVFRQPLARLLRQIGYRDAREVPELYLKDEREQRVLQSLSAPAVSVGALDRSLLRAMPYPRHFLDFETVSSPVPMWAGTRPYQSVPFQWSCHTETGVGVLVHNEFMDVSGNSPAKEFARRLIEAVGTKGVIVVYSSFEQGRIEDLCKLVPEYRQELRDIASRLFDLLPVVRRAYYHPTLQGSYSLKRLAPTACPDLNYSDLNPVADGKAAQRAWWELSSLDTPPARHRQLVDDSLRYCHVDSLSLAAVYRAMEHGRAVTLVELGERPTHTSNVIFSATRRV